MWVFLVGGFFSVVEDRENKSGVVIRGRYKEDIVKISKRLHTKAYKTPTHDYPYRTMCSKDQWSSYIAREALNIDYDNFKAKISKYDWSRALKYSEVWEVMEQTNVIL